MNRIVIDSDSGSGITHSFLTCWSYLSLCQNYARILGSRRSPSIFFLLSHRHKVQIDVKIHDKQS